jgi:hypothetical protein
MFLKGKEENDGEATKNRKMMDRSLDELETTRS